MSEGHEKWYRFHTGNLLSMQKEGIVAEIAPFAESVGDEFVTLEWRDRLALDHIGRAERLIAGLAHNSQVVSNNHTL